MPHGIYERTKFQPIDDRLFKRTIKTETCWLWTGGKTSFGHGVIYNGSYRQDLPRRSKLMAHRVAYELKHGPIPDGLCAIHRCDVPNCVNPDHITTGTKMENSRDMVAKNRAKRGTALPQAKLTNDQVREIKHSNLYQRDLASKYGVSQATICMIRAGKRWTHID